MTVSAEFEPPPAIPVVFSDGAAGKETDLGSIFVDREFRVAKLRSAVARAARVSPEQISLSLVGSDGRRRSPIGEGIDLAAAAAEGGSFVLAALRRAKKGRSRRIRVDARSAGPEAGRTILKRQPQDEMDAERAERERYLMAAAMWYSPFGYGAPLGGEDGNRVCCKVCDTAVESPPPGFHQCLYDAVTVGFRSRVGPIQRPTRA